MQVSAVELGILQALQCLLRQPLCLCILITALVLWILGHVLAHHNGHDSGTPAVTLDDPVRLQRTLNLFALDSTGLLQNTDTAKPLRTEQLCRQMLETMLGQPLPRTRPRWLVNPTTKRPLELDMYNETLRLAFEYDGAHHDVFVPHFHGSEERFRYRQLMDRLKDQLCREAGVRLIRIPWQEVSVNQLPKTAAFLEQLLAQHGVVPRRPLSRRALARGIVAAHEDEAGPHANSS